MMMPPQPAKLGRRIGLFGVFSIAGGAMISSGLFVLPDIAFAYAGPAAFLSYFLAGLLVLPTLCSKAELATAMPRSGGNYFFVERSMGPCFGTIVGLADWMSVGLKAAFALIGLGALGALLVPAHPEVALKATAVGACLIFAGVNVIGTHESKTVQNVLVAGLLAILLVFLATGLPAVDVQRLTPFTPHGWTPVAVVAGMVFVSYGGLTKVVAMAEEVRDPTRNIPLGMLLAYAVVNVIYTLAVFVTVGVVDSEALSGSLVPISLAARSIGGTVGAVVIDLAAFMAFATTANAGIMAASRAPMAMSRDGLLPSFLARTSRRFQTPHVAVLITASAMVAVIDIENLVKTASTVMLVTFLLVNLAVIIMRQSGLQNYRPTFKTPFYPLPQVFAIAIYAVLILEMGRVALVLSSGFVILALLWFLLYVNVRIESKSALIYLIKRIMSGRIVRGRLDEELVRIVLERDEVSFDRFDQLVRKAPIPDPKEALDAQELFRRLAVELSPRTGVDQEVLVTQFMERERESSTVIEPGLAIPHVVVPGEGIFELAVVRCKAGIRFGELQEPVRRVFALVGSLDERNYHMRALMHIAQIVRNEDFTERWSEAKTVDQLRDEIILARRTRAAADDS